MEVLVAEVEAIEVGNVSGAAVCAEAVTVADDDVCLEDALNALGVARSEGATGATGRGVGTDFAGFAVDGRVSKLEEVK